MDLYNGGIKCFCFSTSLGLWAAPMARDTLPNVLRLRRRTFGTVSGAPGVAQTPKIVILQSSNNVGSPPLLPTRAKRSKSGSFGDDPTSTCLKTIEICKQTEKEPSTSATSDFDVPKNRGAPPGPLRGPEGPSGAPPGPLRGPEGPSGALRAPKGPSGAPPGLLRGPLIFGATGTAGRPPSF
jgi:hypothetical protein